VRGNVAPKLGHFLKPKFAHNQATLAGYSISDFALSQDAQRIFRSAARIARSMPFVSQFVQA
jgi:hypothetical protein